VNGKGERGKGKGERGDIDEHGYSWRIQGVNSDIGREEALRDQRGENKDLSFNFL
jgi:hypothetical protein